MVLTIGISLFIAALGAEDQRNHFFSERNPPTPSPSPLLSLTQWLPEHMLYCGDESVQGSRKTLVPVLPSHYGPGAKDLMSPSFCFFLGEGT
jgi:hypothetical protein